MEMVEMMVMMMTMVMVMIRMLISKVFVLALRDIRRCPRLKFRHWRHHTEEDILGVRRIVTMLVMVKIIMNHEV